MASVRAPLIGIVGWKGSGKTTLIERLVRELTARGLVIATVKHAHHGLRTHDGATDGERHARAGARTVAVLAPHEWEIAGERQSSEPPSLDEVAQRLGAADLILVEGFKSAAIPKIEVRQQSSERPLSESDAHVIAIAADHPIAACALPVFSRNDIAGLAAFIEAHASHLRQLSRPQTGQ